VAQAPIVIGLGLLPHGQDPMRILRRGDRTFDQRDVIWTCSHIARSFRKVGDVQDLPQGEQVILQIQDAELTAVAGGELKHPQLGAMLLFNAFPLIHSRALSEPFVKCPL
jgi:hypothetical protein